FGRLGALEPDTRDQLRGLRAVVSPPSRQIGRRAERHLVVDGDELDRVQPGGGVVRRGQLGRQDGHPATRVGEYGGGRGGRRDRRRGRRRDWDGRRRGGG